MPSTMASFDTMRSKPGREGMAAASSLRPRASGAPSASGARPRAIQSNSSGGPLIARDSIQGAVDEAGLGAVEEGLGDLDIFVDHHLVRRITADQLEGPHAQDGAHGGVNPLQPPALGQAGADG